MHTCWLALPADCFLAGSRGRILGYVTITLHYTCCYCIEYKLILYTLLSSDAARAVSLR